VSEAGFIRCAFGAPSTPWDEQGLTALSTLPCPDRFHGRARMLLRADINQQWARWFVESVADPRQYIDKSYPHIFADVYQAIGRLFVEFTLPERKELSSEIAKAVRALSKTLGGCRRRVALSKETRALLLEFAGTPPRCWICGAQFERIAVDNFLHHETRDIPQPMFIDVLKPRGLVQRDLRIEADHVLPFSHGGENEDNLRLACGWCNRHKSAYTTLYDIEGASRAAGVPESGFTSLPHPLWTTRVLAVRQRCEFEGGCIRATNDTELTVSFGNSHGSPNPVNLRVTCYDHDPHQPVRLQPRRIARLAWERG
jgi:hypothetical protein